MEDFSTIDMDRMVQVREIALSRAIKWCRGNPDSDLVISVAEKFYKFLLLPATDTKFVGRKE